MIVFLFHRFNDLDHIAPICYKVAKDNSRKVLLLSINPDYDIYNDYRLSFLRKNNVSVDYLYNFTDLKILRLILSLRLNKKLGNRIKSFFDHVLKKKYKYVSFISELFNISLLLPVFLLKKYFIDPLFNKFLVKFYYSVEWSRNILEKNKVSVIIVDHSVRPGLYIAGPFFSAAKKKNIPIISVPHGILLFHSDHSHISRSYIAAKEADVSIITFPYNEWRKSYLKRGFDPKRLFVTGSARFSKEWMRILHTIIPKANLPTKRNMLKVVYMERQGDRHGMYKTIVKETLLNINQLPYVDLVIKPGTRSNILHFNTDNVNFKVVDDIDSVALIEWADVVICLSSILFEVLLQDKVFINAKFLHGQTLMFDEYNVGWTVESYEELLNALERLKENPKFKPYTAESVERFLSDFIFDRSTDNCPLENYKNLIYSVSNFN